MKKILTPQPLVNAKPMMGILRIVMGIFMIYHGFEVFDKEAIAVYTRQYFLRYIFYDA